MHTGGIGDFLLACPSIRQLSAQGPVQLIGHVNRLQLAVAGGIAEGAQSLESIDFETILERPSERLREFLGRFHQVVIWMRDEDGRIAENVAACAVNSVHVHAGLPPEDWTRHASIYYTSCLNLRNEAEFYLRIEPADVDIDVMIHPGSGSPDKNWPLRNFMNLAEDLEAAGRSVTWCLGPAELERDPGRFKDTLRGKDCLHPETPLDLARLLAAARQYIGNDSGVTHLAAAVGCPTLALFGSTDAEVWAPKRSQVLSFEEAQVDTIVRMLTAKEPVEG